MDKELYDNRPTFWYNNDENKKIRAGGVLFYKFNETTLNLEFLMIHNKNNYYEDFGGRTDIEDNDIIDTICREVEEESNKIFKKEFIRKELINSKSTYIKQCKYLLYFVELKNYHDPKKFGEIEIHDNIERTVEWITYDDFCNKNFLEKLNFRLKSYNVSECIKNLLVD